MVLHFLRDAIGLKDSRHLFIQSEVKPKPIVTRSHAFSRALRQPHVITSSFDWFNVLSVSYVIGQSNYFGFGFTTLKRKPLYQETFSVVVNDIVGIRKMKCNTFLISSTFILFYISNFCHKTTSNGFCFPILSTVTFP